MIGDVRQFRFWCQKVLPLVYDDSLSYYEVLCKVVKYLNSVIELIKNVPDYVDEVINERLQDDHLIELFSSFVKDIEAAISSHNEETNTNASSDYEIGEMLWWKDKLYIAIRKIDNGDTLIVGTNIKETTFEELYNGFISKVKRSVTKNDEGNNTTASKDFNIGEWLWLNDELYLVTSNINEGNAYVFSGDSANVKDITIEERMEILYSSTAKKITINGTISD